MQKVWIVSAASQKLLALAHPFEWPDGVKLVPESDDVKMTLERRFGRPGGAKLALERRFGRPDGVKLALERRFGRPGVAFGAGTTKTTSAGPEASDRNFV